MAQASADGIARDRIAGAIWGALIGDALAMPVHWYYNREKLRADYGVVDGYVAARAVHPESMIGGMSYSPDPESKRNADILGDKAKLFLPAGNRNNLKQGEHTDEHGNRLRDAEDQRVHYHANLPAGANTVAGHLIRVMLRDVSQAAQNPATNQQTDQGVYDPDRFLRAFIDFMLSKGHNDSYLEVYLRRWWERYSTGVDPHRCSQRQRDTWSIGSMSSTLLPMVVSLLSAKPGRETIGLVNAITQQQLLQVSENTTGALIKAVPVLLKLVQRDQEADPLDLIRGLAEQVFLPAYSGKQMITLYREHKGPNNIPAPLCWSLHTKYDSRTVAEAVDDWLKTDAPLDDVCGAEGRLGHMCYIEQGVPVSLYFLLKHLPQEDGFRKALLANANCGGDSTHRGGFMGLLAGATVGASGIPQELKEGLVHFKDIEAEIERFVDVAVTFPTEGRK